MRVPGTRHVPALLVLLILGLVGAPLAVAAQAQSPVRYEGVASCAGSTCHGRAEGDGAVVRQDEIATWQEPSTPSGAHSRAYAVLDSDARAADRRAARARASRPRAARCLGCHATPAPAASAARASSYRDGVGCESLPRRGLAAGSPATMRVGAHATRPMSRAGMTPLEQPAGARAVCLDCHFGSAKPAASSSRHRDDGRRPPAHLLRARPVLDAAAAP